MTRVWTVLELIRWTTPYLEEKGFENPRLNAELLLAGVLGLKRLDLYLQYDRPLDAEELAEFKGRLRRRLRREPLQYIEGRAAFRELQLRVDRRVLIPRPETETLVGEVLARVEGREGLAVLDVGTGSGAIALSLAAEGPFSRVVAIDVSEAALQLAQENHRTLLPNAMVEFRLGNGYAPVEGERFDVVVSNPPYIAAAERELLAPEVRDWEPAEALFAGPDGLEVLEALIAGAADHLRPEGLFAVEVGLGQAERVADLIRREGRLDEPRVRRDLAGRPRIVSAESPATRLEDEP